MVSGQIVEGEEGEWVTTGGGEGSGFHTRPGNLTSINRYATIPNKSQSGCSMCYTGSPVYCSHRYAIPVHWIKKITGVLHKHMGELISIFVLRRLILQ